jgi:opacity protein-like surface antigen
MVRGRLALVNTVAASVLAVSFSTAALAADMSGGPAPVGYAGWSGLYAGGFLGTADQNGSGSNNTVWGLQAGYNHRLEAKWLIGAEGELGWTSGSRFFDTLDAKLGYVLGPWMLYVKGGGAWEGSTDGGNSTTQSGFSVGGGVEYMFARNWSAKAEYEHLDFGSSGGHNGNSNTVNEFKVGVNYHFAPGTIFGIR